MEKEVRRHQKIHLALAIAGGESIAAWANKMTCPEHGVLAGRGTRRYAAKCEAWRRYVLDQAIGRLARLTLKATDGITTARAERRVRVGSAQGVAGDPGRP